MFNLKNLSNILMKLSQIFFQGRMNVTPNVDNQSLKKINGYYVIKKSCSEQLIVNGSTYIEGSKNAIIEVKGLIVANGDIQASDSKLQNIEVNGNGKFENCEISNLISIIFTFRLI